MARTRGAWLLARRQMDGMVVATTINVARPFSLILKSPRLAIVSRVFLPEFYTNTVPAFGCARGRCPVQLVRRKLRRDPQSPPQRIDIHVGGAGSLIRIKRRLNGQHLCASRVPIAHRECLSAIRVPRAASQARGQPGWRGETPWDRARFSCC